jgi:glycine/D-amino acid oxidase-like deaminating enzyme
VTKRQRTGVSPSHALDPVRGYQPAQQYAPEPSPLRRHRIRHLDEKTTIIIGAGVVGLAIARELAAEAFRTETAHTIIVVEKNISYATETSHHCAGIIAKHGVPKEYKPLLDLSLESWHTLLNSDHGKIRKDLRYLPHGVLHAKPKYTEQQESHEVPTWYNLRPQDVLKAYNSDIGKM